MLRSAPKINFQSFAQSMSAVCSPGGVDAVVSEEKVHYRMRSRDEDRSGERKRIMEPSTAKQEIKGNTTGGIYHRESEKDTTSMPEYARKRDNKRRKQVTGYIALISKPDTMICIHRNE